MSTLQAEPEWCFSAFLLGEPVPLLWDPPAISSQEHQGGETCKVLLLNHPSLGEAVSPSSLCPGGGERILSLLPTLPMSWAEDVASQSQPTRAEMPQSDLGVSTSPAYHSLTSSHLFLQLLVFSLL